MTIDPLRREQWKLELYAKRKALLEIRHSIEPEIRQIEETLRVQFGESVNG